MENELFDRDTMLDLTVNLIPLGVLLVFVVIYLVFNPFGFGSVISSIQFAIIGTMFIGLAVLTYYSGAAVSRAEKQTEADAALEGEEAAEALDGEDTAAEPERQAPAELNDGDGEGPDEDGPEDDTGAESDDTGETEADTDDGADETA